MPEKLPRLCYQTNDELAQLPGWAYFLIRLGQEAVAASNPGYRLVVALSLPTRAFACALLATGVVLERVGFDQLDLRAQVRFVRSLPIGTAVYVRRDNNRRLKGIVERFERYDGADYIFIKISGLETRGFALDRFAPRITVAEKAISLPANQQTGWLVEPPSEFLQVCLGEELAQTHVLENSHEVVLIGKKSLLKHEICSTRFFCENPAIPRFIAGHLQDILRVLEFSSANASCHSRCLASSAEDYEEDVGKHIPKVVAFDGAMAYLRHSHRWPRSHQVVLLDRTERQYSDAVELLDQNFAYRSGDELELHLDIPKNIEMMLYTERI